MSAEENREATLETFRVLAEQEERKLRARRIDAAVRATTHVSTRRLLSHHYDVALAYAKSVRADPAAYPDRKWHRGTLEHCAASEAWRSFPGRLAAIRAEYRRIVEREEGRA